MADKSKKTNKEIKKEELQQIISTETEPVKREISTEMEQSYLNYAMSVIVSRALPDVRDGLKPVHRRTLFSMFESGYLHNKAYKKSARVAAKPKASARAAKPAAKKP